MTARTILLWLLATVGWPAILLALSWFFIALPAMQANKASEVSIPVKEAPAAKKAGKAKVSVKAPITVYKPSAQQGLKLPPIKPTEQVIAASQVRASDRPQTVSTVIDTETGESRSFTKQDEYPWFAVEPRGEARLSLGYKIGRQGRAEQVVRLGVNYDAVRVKAFTAGVTATIDSDGQSFAGLSLAYRW